MQATLFLPCIFQICLSKKLSLSRFGVDKIALRIYKILMKDMITEILFQKFLDIFIIKKKN